VTSSSAARDALIALSKITITMAPNTNWDPMIGSPLAVSRGHCSAVPTALDYRFNSQTALFAEPVDS
jgi:hypothetical protein